MMFWIGFGTGIVAFILVFSLLVFIAGCKVSGKESQWERERVVFQPNKGPELEAGEIAEWNTNGHWEIYKDGELVRYWPEWEGEPV